MSYKFYNFEKHFNYIRKELGNNIYYDDFSLKLSGVLYLRFCKVNNFAQISKLKNGKFNLLFCFNDIGIIYNKNYKSFEN